MTYDMKEKIFILFIFLFLFSACKKQVDKDRPEFIGYWHAKIADNYCARINISENSSAYYTIIWQDHETTYSGTARANDNKLTIGRTKYFDIVEYPHHIDTAVEKEYVYTHDNKPIKLANWKMVLKGLQPDWLHVCGTWTYYKADY
jgi:hypothetical protein